MAKPQPPRKDEYEDPKLKKKYIIVYAYFLCKSPTDTQLIEMFPHLWYRVQTVPVKKRFQNTAEAPQYI